MKWLYLVFSFVFLFSCSKSPKTPEGLINMFVKDMAKNNVSRSYFEEHASGEFKERILGLSDEDFGKFTKMNVKNPSVKILSKSCEESKCSLTYIVRYDVYDKSSKTFQSEVKKLAQVVKEGKQWKLLSVTNIKTFFNSTEPINTLEK